MLLLIDAQLSTNLFLSHIHVFIPKYITGYSSVLTYTSATLNYIDILVYSNSIFIHSKTEKREREAYIQRRTVFRSWWALSPRQANVRCLRISYQYDDDDWCHWCLLLLSSIYWSMSVAATDNHNNQLYLSKYIHNIIIIIYIYEL